MVTAGTPELQRVQGSTAMRKRARQEILPERYGLYVPPNIGERFFMVRYYDYSFM